MKKTMTWMCLAALLTAAGCTNQFGSIVPPAVPKSATAHPLAPQALKILKAGLENDNSYIRTPAIEITAETGQKQFLPSVVQSTDHRAVTARFAAAVALGDMQCKSCRPVLQKKLDDENPNVRIAAAYSLVKIGDKKYQEMIRRALNSTDPTVKANAILLLGKLGDQEDLNRIRSIMHNNDEVEKVRFQALESLSRLGDPKVYREKIWPLLISKYHDDRVWGIRCMGALATPEAKTAVQTMLQDDILEVRLTAAEQLGQLGDRSGKDRVREYLEQTPNLDETSMANQMAVSAIGTIGDQALNAYLPKALASKSPIIQLIAAKAVLMQ